MLNSVLDYHVNHRLYINDRHSCWILKCLKPAICIEAYGENNPWGKLGKRVVGDCSTTQIIMSVCNDLLTSCP